MGYTGIVKKSINAMGTEIWRLHTGILLAEMAKF